MLNFDDLNLLDYFILSNQPMLLTNEDATLILTINAAAVKLTGFDFAAYFPQPVESILQTKKNRLASINIKPLTQKKLKKEFTLISKAGKTGFVEADITPVLFEGKEAQLFTLTDITEKKLYRAMLEDAMEEEVELKTQNRHLKKIAYLNLQLARRPLANILGLVDVIDQEAIADQTLAEAIAFLRESGRELNELIKTIDPEMF